MRLCRRIVVAVATLGVLAVAGLPMPMPANAAVATRTVDLECTGDDSVMQGWMFGGPRPSQDVVDLVGQFATPPIPTPVVLPFQAVFEIDAPEILDPGESGPVEYSARFLLPDMLLSTLEGFGVTQLSVSNLHIALAASNNVGDALAADPAPFVVDLTADPVLAPVMGPFDATVIPDVPGTPIEYGVDRVEFGVEVSADLFGDVAFGVSCTAPDGHLTETTVTGDPPGPVGSTFRALDPVRLIDPRPATRVGPFTSPWGAGETREVQVTGGVSGVPAGADAVVLNVTITDVTAAGGTFLSVFPAGAAVPNVSSLNAAAGQTVPNAVTVKLSDAGRISIYNHKGTANVIVDVSGFYDDTAGVLFNSLAPDRLIDSRPATQRGPFSTPWGAGQTREVQVGGLSGVPADAVAVVLNVTVTDVRSASFLTVFPAGGVVPNVSNLNFSPGDTIANQVTVKLSDLGRVGVFNRHGSVNVIIDVNGFFRAGEGLRFFPIEPERVIDPRPAWQTGPFSTPWTAAQTRVVDIEGLSARVPVEADAVVSNVTVTDVTSPAGTFLSVFPGGAVPQISNLNAAAGQTLPNAVTARLSPTGGLSVFNSNGTANVIVDVNGYYA